METQLAWALQTASVHQIPIEASIADFRHMLAKGLNAYKALRIDDAVTGSNLGRVGFQALLADATADKSISHVFVYRRDRLARPEDACEMVSMERRLRETGVTIVFSNCVAEPRQRGLLNIGDDMQMYVEYFQSGEFLVSLAERVINGHRGRAVEGYRTGGKPPYGFVRILVDSSGMELEELPPGKVVRQPGCRVRIKPKDEGKIKVWCMILDFKHQGWGGKRIASYLNQMGIPSPDAGRTRTDRGVKHRVTGKWCNRTVLELCDNAAIIGMQEYGKRSEGKFRRLSPDGSRLLDEQDRIDERNVRLVNNPDELLIKSDIRIDPLYDPKKWKEIHDKTAERSRNQRGISRAKDPTKYPLSCRVVDLTEGCGAIMYGREHGGKRIYICGRYSSTSGAECHNNGVDGEALLGVATGFMRQTIEMFGGRDKLRTRIQHYMDNEQPQAAIRAEGELVSLETRRSELLRDLQTAGANFTLAPSDQIRKMVEQNISTMNVQLTDVEASIHQLSSASARSSDADGGMEAAIHLFDQFNRILADPTARQQLVDMIQLLDARAGLSFIEGIKGAKRKVRRLAGGALYFGSTPLPVPLHGKDNCQPDPNSGESKIPPEVLSAELPKSTKADGGEDVTSPPTASVDVPLCRPEGVSFTKVSRGDWI